MTGLVAPGNDYRKLASMPMKDELKVSVVIPIYNRVELLDNVLAGLSAQNPNAPFEVIVVDDGSEEDVLEVCNRWSESLDVRYVRQDHDGNGAARARNTGARLATGGLLVFLDADSIPSPNFISGHVAWHVRADNIVVSTSRRHIDRRVDADEVRSGWSRLISESGVDANDADRAIAPDDWRRVFYRRTQRLLLGNEAYRVVLGCSLSVRAEQFDDVGGFDAAFRTWGGEDTELGWRLWNAGCFIVPDDEIMVLHQRHLDFEGGTEGRQMSRSRFLMLMADRVPQRFYRKMPSHLFSVPKVSWIVQVGSEADAERAWKEASAASFTDTELILVGHGESVNGLVVAATFARDLTVTKSFGDAMVAARGEVVAIVDGRARFDRRLLARAMKRFNDPGTGAVRVGYKSAGNRLLRLSDLERIDSVAGYDGLPFFALVRRRELMKDRLALENPGVAWTAALERSKIELLVNDLVEIPAEAAGSTDGKRPGLREIISAGPSEVARGVKRSVVPRTRQQDSTAHQHAPEDRPGIEYVGLAGQSNLGDDAMLLAIRQLMPWAEVGSDVRNPRAVMLGGGTLLNTGGYYLNKIRRVDGPRLERVVFGTGVRSVEFWGETDNVDDWDPFLRSALSVGVRGPLSMDQLRSWGYKGPARVIGDPALTLRRPHGVKDVDGRVIVCPVFTGGDCWGGDDQVVFDALAQSISRLEAEGRDVVMMTSHPNDDRWAIEIMRSVGLDGLPYVPGYEDIDAALDLIASSDLVIGERLHAVVLAAAVGTPFVSVEYRPKLRDFALSVGNEDSLVRTDSIEDLDRAIGVALEDPTGRSEATTEAVEVFRQDQVAVAELLKSELVA